MFKDLCIILILFQITISLDPGVVVTVKKSIFDKVKHKFIPIIYSQIKHLDIKQEIEISSKAKVHEIKVNVGELNPENIKLTEPDEKTINIVVENFSMHLVALATVHEFITSSGTITCDGTIDSITLNLVFREIGEKNPKPFIDLNLTHYRIDTSKWHFALDFKYIPEWLIDLIINAFKKTILTDILPVITDMITKTTNNVLEKNYPIYTNLQNYDLAVATQMVQKPTFDKDNLVLMIDGTFFNEQKGYRRLSEPDFIEIKENGLALNAFLSQYSLESFFDVVYNKDFDFKIGDYEIFFKTIAENKPIVFKDTILRIKDFHIEGGIKIGTNTFTLKTKISSDFMIDSIDQKNKKIIMEIIEFRFDQFEIDSNIKYLKYISPVIKQIIQWFFAWKKFFYVQIPIIKLPYDIEMGNLDLNILEHSINFGLDLNFK